MKLLKTSFVLLILTVACANKEKAPKAPLNAPNRQKDHKAAACPAILNGNFEGTKGTRKAMVLSHDRQRNLVVKDNSDKVWVVDGLPQYMNGNKNQSYVAICGPVNRNDGSGPINTGIIIQAFKDSPDKPIYTLTYGFYTTDDGVAFDYAKIRPDESHDEQPDTYLLVR